MEELARIEWNTFVIRLRRETPSGAWHGEIVHLGTQADRHFVTLQEVAAFLAQHAPGLERQATAPLAPDHSTPQSRADTAARI